MSEAAAQLAPERTLEDLLAAHAAAVGRAADEMARLRRVISAAAAGGLPLGEHDIILSMNDLADLKLVILADKELLSSAATVVTMGQALEARRAAAGPAPETRPSSRRRESRPAHLRSVGA